MVANGREWNALYGYQHANSHGDDDTSRRYTNAYNNARLPIGYACTSHNGDAGPNADCAVCISRTGMLAGKLLSAADTNTVARWNTNAYPIKRRHFGIRHSV